MKAAEAHLPLVYIGAVILVILLTYIQVGTKAVHHVLAGLAMGVLAIGVWPGKLSKASPRYPGTAVVPAISSRVEVILLAVIVLASVILTFRGRELRAAVKLLKQMKAPHGGPGEEEGGEHK